MKRACIALFFMLLTFLGYSQNNFIADSTSLLVKCPFNRDTIPSFDTIFIPKKIRMPLWSYHHKNTIINGVSLGLLSIDNRNNVINNGVRLELIGTSVFMPFVIGMALFTKPQALLLLGIDGLVLEDNNNIPVRLKNRMDITNGFSISLLGSLNENTVVNGFVFGGILNSTYKSNGLSLTGLYNIQHISNGIQIGGLSAKSYDIKGLQLSLINHSTIVTGLQIGIFNSTKILKGIQIGIWNKNKKRSLPLINWGF